MPVNEKATSNLERTAKEQLEFYGFWLWNYKYAFSHSPDPEWLEILEANREFESLQNESYACDECGINETYKDCTSCGIKSRHDKDLFVEKIYRPWLDQRNDELSSLDKRFSADHILMNAYNNAADCHKYLDFSKGYRLEPLNLAVEIIKSDLEVMRENTSAKSNIVTAKIDFSLPLEIIIEDVSRIKKSIVWGDSFSHKKIENSHCIAYSDNINYEMILASLKKLSSISFNYNHSARALGFWLWENVTNFKKYISIPDAIANLTSGHEYPEDILKALGFPESLDPEDAMRRYRRYHQRTVACIKEGEVLTLR